MIGVGVFSSRRRHTRWTGDWSSDVCSSDLALDGELSVGARQGLAQLLHRDPRFDYRFAHLSRQVAQIPGGRRRVKRGPQGVPQALEHGPPPPVFPLSTLADRLGEEGREYRLHRLRFAGGAAGATPAVLADRLLCGEALPALGAAILVDGHSAERSYCPPETMVKLTTRAARSSLLACSPRPLHSPGFGSPSRSPSWGSRATRGCSRFARRPPARQALSGSAGRCASAARCRTRPRRSTWWPIRRFPGPETICSTSCCCRLSPSPRRIRPTSTRWASPPADMNGCSRRG